MKHVLPYRFQSAETGMVSEIMLPKKMQYQGILFNMLQKGLNCFSFQDNFRKHARHLRPLLEPHLFASRLDTNLTRMFDEKFPALFAGYSMHEVDGAFKFKEEFVNGKVRPRFVEERTQVVKVYFIPDYAQIQAGIPFYEGNIPSVQSVMDFSDLFFATSRGNPFDFQRMQLRLAPHLDHPTSLQTIGIQHISQADHILQELKTWMDAVSFFLFGFLLYEICRSLNMQYSAGDFPYLEEEIWIASQWGVLVNRAVLLR